MFLADFLRLNPFLEPLARQQVREAHGNFVDQAGDWAWQNLPALYQKTKRAVSFDEMTTGMIASIESRTSRWATWYFACASGDFNRVHFDPRGVAPFKGPICHGMHVASFISRVLGTELPGPGTIFSKMNGLAWHAPVYIGETVKTTLRIEKLEAKRKPDGLHRITFSALAHTKAGTLVLEAEPVAYIR